MSSQKYNTILTIITLIIAASIISFTNPFIAFILLAGLFILAISFKNPLNGVLFLAFYLPFEPFFLKFVPDNIYLYANFFSDGLIIFLFISLFLKYLTKEQNIKYRKTPINYLIVSFFLVWLTSTLYNQVDFIVAVSSLRQLLRYALVYYLIIYAGFNQKFIRYFLYICLGVLLLQSLLGLSQLFLPESFSNLLTPNTTQRTFSSFVQETGNFGWNPAQRISGTFGRYDKLGIFLSFFLILLTTLAYHLKKIKHFTWPLFITGSLALIFTFSRLSWAGFIIGILLIGWLWKKDKKVKFTFITITTSLIIFFLAYLSLTGFNIKTYQESQTSLNLPNRVLQTFSKYEMQNSYYGYGRIFFWINTPTRVVASSPIFGVGPGMYGSGTAAAFQIKETYNRLGLPFGVQNRIGQIDNNWLSLWGEYGTLGLIIWLILFIALFKQGKTIYKNSLDPLHKSLGLALMAISITYPLQNFFGPYFEIRTISFYFWTLSAIVIKLNQTYVKQ